MDFDNNIGTDSYSPLFPVGFGRSYAEPGEDLGPLSEVSGTEALAAASKGGVFRKGGTVSPWKAFLTTPSEGVLFNGSTANVAGLSASRTDHLAQEDALLLKFSADDARLVFLPDGEPVDWSGELEEGKFWGLRLRTKLQSPLNWEWDAAAMKGAQRSRF